MSTTKSQKAAEPAPASVSKVAEIGTTSAPLKSAAFFIGAHCKEYNGALSWLLTETLC